MSTRSSVFSGSVLLATGIATAAIAAQQPTPTAANTRAKSAASASTPRSAPKGPALGVPATEAQIESADVSIGPDGAGLPAGSGSPTQGEAIFNVKCIACHGARGAGGMNDQLVGGQGTLSSPAPIKTIGSYWPYATTIFDYVRRAMPYPTPHSLTDAEVYALTAYLLNLNGIIEKHAVMDAKSLPRVQMPNRGN